MPVSQGVYLAKYLPGEGNSLADGGVRDAMGATVKYQCTNHGCAVYRKKKQMGYKVHGVTAGLYSSPSLNSFHQEFCIHMANEHGGLEEVLRADERRELREVGEKLEAGQ